MIVRAASRQAGLLFGVQRAYHNMSSGPALNFLVKSAFVKTPGRSLHSVSYGNEAWAWTPLVHHKSTAASQAAEEVRPEKIKEIHNEKPASGTCDHEDEKLAMTKSNYWELVPKKLYKEDGTPWR